MTLEESINQWKRPPFDQATINEVKELASNPTALEDAFYKEIEFGTGGMRGVMGAGTNRINKYTLGKASQGLANYLNDKKEERIPKIVIAYDCRHNSDTFALAVAEVFSANGIQAFLFSSLRPTPLLSFAVRYLKADAGIVLTASHNPPEYNGYKVYNKYGGQIVPPEDTAIMDRIKRVNYTDIKWEKNEKLIQYIDKEIDQAYTTTTVNDSLLSPVDRKETKIVFTPLHGTSIISLPPVLEQAGFQNVHIVEEQKHPDGDFPTVISPNPEEKEAFTLALKKAKEIDADIILGTDPDADRIGIGVKDLDGQWKLLNGNQLMVVLTRFVLEQQSIHPNSFIASTVVSTPLMEKMAKGFGLECKLGLTGFKWIGKMIQDNPHQNFLCGGEESYGFLVGDKVRDKDAISAALLACDLQAHLKGKNSSIYRYLLDTYRRFGCYHETLLSVTKKGKQGAEEIAQLMQKMRHSRPHVIAGTAVEKVDDFEIGLCYHTNGTTTKLDFPKANVLKFHLEGGATVAVRPSGTEPKIKFYISVNHPLKNLDDYAVLEKQLASNCEELLNAITQ
ncbi:MAG: phospho-sugar mutase [Flavobacteriaceae bacterium]